MTNSKAKADYDVVIAGAGIAGLTLAASLMGKGLKIAVLNNQKIADKNELSIVDNLRYIALTLGSQQCLQQLAIWQELNAKQPAPFRSLQVWEAGKDAQLFFDSADVGQATLGYILKSVDLQQALFASAQTDRESVCFLSETLIDIQANKDQRVLVLASAKTISTYLVVGADGINSTVRQLAGLAVNTADYQQCALIATVRTQKTHQHTARQIFLPTGPLAFLPVADLHYCSIVWSTTPEEAHRLKELSDAQFCLELADAFEHALGSIESTSIRLTFPLKTQQVQQYIQQGIALIGDAAHIIHPLAGQGANLAIADAVCLARVIVAAKQKQRSIGALHTLRAYERERRFHNRLMNASVDGIKQLFAIQTPWLQRLRQFGLTNMNKMPSIKNIIARYAMDSQF